MLSSRGYQVFSKNTQLDDFGKEVVSHSSLSKVEIVSSEALVVETNNNPYNERRTFVESVLQEAKYFQSINENMLIRAEEIEATMGIKGLDSLHLVCAEELRVDYFITCDDKIIKRYRGTVTVQNPTEFVNNVINS
ncbi:MAG: PIN domain-containing protein [Cyanobacteriota bacterium]|nr:PIN domain-containing protein [Cyanobacteriota bacterium]